MLAVNISSAFCFELQYLWFIPKTIQIISLLHHLCFKRINYKDIMDKPWSSMRTRPTEIKMDGRGRGSRQETGL